MLIARAPVRISFAGGGTDMPSFYEEHGGVVISTSINKYFYVFINDLGIGDSQIISADFKSLFSVSTVNPNEVLNSDLVWEGDLALPKAVLSHFKPQQGENIFISCEVPPGTGLGSSSAAAVGLITALSRQRRKELTKAQIAELACHIEIDKLRMPIGKQDQYASAFGGLNQITFTKDKIEVEPIQISANGRAELESHLMLFFTGVSRKSTTILSEQKASVQRDDQAVLENLNFMKQLAQEVRYCFEKEAFANFGKLLDEGWQRKKKLSANIANSNINSIYEAAIEAGADGGKITGAGGGGFLLMYCAPEKQPSVTKAMEAHGLRRMLFRFDTKGSHVLLDLQD